MKLFFMIVSQLIITYVPSKPGGHTRISNVDGAPIDYPWNSFAYNKFKLSYIIWRFHPMKTSIVHQSCCQRVTCLILNTCNPDKQKK